MSWTYSGNPASSLRDECRFMIGDTDISAPILQDEEIDYLIQAYGVKITDVYQATDRLRYELFRHVATVFSRDIKRSLGPQSEDPTSRLNFYNEQMRIYKARLSSSGLSVPKYAHPKVFHKGMHNNPPWKSGGVGNV